MNLYDPVWIRALLEKHGHQFSKGMGQNFLTRPDIAERIAATADKSCCVVEIGPGHGALTNQLCRSAASVTSIELDTRLLPVLEETMAGFDNLRVINADALKADFAAICREMSPQLTPVLCANLPYNITTPVLTALAKQHFFTRMTVMVQKEVTERLTARPGTERYGVLTALLQAHYNARVLFDVPASCFVPQPHVDSSVITFEKRETPAVEEELWPMYARVVTAAFAQRRKTLSNALEMGGLCAKGEAAGILTACGWDPRIRGERLSPEEFAGLAAALQK